MKDFQKVENFPKGKILPKGKNLPKDWNISKKLKIFLKVENFPKSSQDLHLSVLIFCLKLQKNCLKYIKCINVEKNSRQ